jgi:hypothetical protein
LVARRKDSARVSLGDQWRVSTNSLCPKGIGIPNGIPEYPHSDGVALLDVIYVVAVIALFGLIALIARAVEKL